MSKPRKLTQAERKDKEEELRELMAERITHQSAQQKIRKIKTSIKREKKIRKVGKKLRKVRAKLPSAKPLPRKKKKKRKPSKYNLFVKKHRKRGVSMKEVGALWRKSKKSGHQSGHQSSHPKIDKLEVIEI